MEITPSPTPLAERILGIAERLRAEPADGLIESLLKLTLLCMLLTLGLLAGLYEKGLLQPRKPAPARGEAPETAARRECVAAEAKSRAPRVEFESAAAEVEVEVEVSIEAAAVAPAGRVRMVRAVRRAGVAARRSWLDRGGGLPGLASKGREGPPATHVYFVTI